MKLTREQIEKSPEGRRILNMWMEDIELSGRFQKLLTEADDALRHFIDDATAGVPRCDHCCAKVKVLRGVNLTRHGRGCPVTYGRTVRRKIAKLRED